MAAFLILTQRFIPPMEVPSIVIPAKAGTQRLQHALLLLGPRLREDDNLW